MNKLTLNVLGALALGTQLASAAEAATPIDGGNTAWILTATALVLFMTMPGLALFYGGLVRGRNVLSVMAQCTAIGCVASSLWIGGLYSLAFKGDGGWIGTFDLSFLKPESLMQAAPNTTIPEAVFLMFQMTFAIITPGLYVGAVVERMKFSALLLFVTLWMFVVYIPLAHMVWGVTGFKRMMGADDSLDVFGVHGIGGIVGALLTGVFTAPSLGGTGGDDFNIATQLWVQAEGVLITMVWSAVIAYLAYKIVDVVIGLRVSAEDEREGLDITSHGETAYHS